MSPLVRASSLDTQKCSIEKERAKRRSPNVRNQSVSNLSAIPFVTEQVPREITLLVEKPRRDHAAKQHRAHEGPERAPKASNVARIIKRPPEYIGWRTMP